MPVIDQAVERIPWKTAQRDFFFRLPEHVRFLKGSSLQLVMRASPELLQEVCSLSVEVNRKTLFTGGPGEPLITAPSDPTIRFALPVDPEILSANWNRASVRFILRKSPGAADALSESASWEVHSSDSYFTLAFERLPLFPELRRFPYSLAEEQLLRHRMSPLDPVNPAVALLVPETRRPIHLRAIGVLGACLGKVTYLDECRIAHLSSFVLEARERNGIVVGRRDELASLELPETLRERMEQLGTGQGLLAEIIVGTLPDQYRWIVLAGADDVGLEKALLTLASETALLDIQPNPAVIDDFPTLSKAQEAAARPGPLSVSLGRPERPDIVFRGIYDSEQTFYDWSLPPGFQTGTGSVMRLDFTHSQELIDPGSHLEILVNGISVGVTRLTAGNAKSGSEEIVLPPGLRGAVPMAVTFRARLDLNAVNCDPVPTERAWLVVSGKSTIESNPVRETIEDLHQVQGFLMQDLFMRQAAFLLPMESSIEELQWFLDLMIRLGHSLSGSPALWPEVCGYGRDMEPAPSRLVGRNVLMLGSISELEAGLPKDMPNLVRMNGGYTRSVYLQGRRYPLKQFEPSLAMASLHPSPWSPDKTLVAAGGWQTYGVPALRRMLTDPESPGHVYGEFCAMDIYGRSAAYDPKATQPESLAECLFRKIPAGLTPEETMVRRFAEESGARRSSRINYAVFVWMGTILLLLIVCRLWLMWENARVNKRVSHQNKSMQKVS